MSSWIRLESLTGFVAEGDVVGVNQALMEGRRPLIVNPLDWPLPQTLAALAEPVALTEVAASENSSDFIDLDLASTERIGVTDELIEIRPGVAFLRPPSLIVGLSIEEEATAGDVNELLTWTLAQASLSRSSICALAVSATNLRHPSIASLGLPMTPVNLRTFSTEVGALDVAGPSGRVLVGERVSERVSLTIARRRAPEPIIDLTAPVGDIAGHR